MAAIKYRDFDLGIWREGDRYVAQVRDSPAGASDRIPFSWPFKVDNDTLLRELELAVTRDQGYRGALMSPDEKKLREFGSAVFEAVFRGAPKVSDLYYKSLSAAEGDGHALRLKLRVDPPELAVLPWEYVYDGVGARDYVCLDENQPLVRFVEGKVPNMTVDGPLRILAIVSNPLGDLDADKERRRIDKSFDKVPDDQHELRWVQAGTTDALFQAMKDGPWHIFHYIGHGGTETFRDAAGEAHTFGYLLMQDGEGKPEKVFPTQLAKILKVGKVRMAVLNCCDSGRGPGFSSLGATLVNTSVPLVVAMQFPISDQAALEFSEEFYGALVEGESVENAVTMARNCVHIKSGLEWGIPVLFTRVDPMVMFHGHARSAQQFAVHTPPADGEPVPAAPVPTLSRAQEEFRRLWSQ